VPFEGGIVKSVKALKNVAMGVAALGALGAAALGVTSVAAIPAAPVQLAAVLNSLADPSVSFANKGNLVEGGISGTAAHVADHKLQKAAKNGDLPLTFNITNIAPGAPGSVTADVAVSGPKLPNPVSQSVTFVNQGGWVLSRASAMELIQAAGQ
jgi:hypothetical protein